MPLAPHLRLTLVTETFPPEVNGVARTLGRWVDTFRDRGHAVQVIRPRQPADAPSGEHVHGLPVPFYPGVRLGIISPARLRGMLLRSNPDLIHVATEGPLGVAALVASAGLGVPVVSSFHTNFDHYLAHYGLAGLEPVASAYLTWFHNQTGLTLAPGQSACDRLRSIGIRQTAVWSRGVDASVFHPRHRDPALRRELGIDEEGVLLLYVGRLAPEKNLNALLDCYAGLRRRLPEESREQLRLALVGDGPQAAALAARGAAGVVLAGAKHGAELSRWYASADVFAFPSRSETFGNVVLEAQASGLPVVGYDCPALGERVSPGHDGFLAVSDEEFAGALHILCADRGRGAAMATAARAKAERQAWPAIFDTLESLYRQLIEARRLPRPPHGPALPQTATAYAVPGGR
jgi:glycosyltransferase involved in cell wall biosynthesis